jgi:hypothetical protein
MIRCCLEQHPSASIDSSTRSFREVGRGWFMTVTILFYVGRAAMKAATLQPANQTGRLNAGITTAAMLAASARDRPKRPLCR